MLAMMSEQSLTKTHRRAGGAARKAPLKPCSSPASFTTSNSVPGRVRSTNGHRDGELAALRARYEGLVKVANARRS